MKLSGSSQTSHKKLTFERAKDSSVLSNFSCGITALDTFIHNELQDYLDMGSCNLFTVKDDDIIVAMFCLENSNLTLSDSAKENMREGRKPIPDGIPVSSDDFYWLKPMYEATEITYLAVSFDRQHNHIGSTIIETIMRMIGNHKEYTGDFVIVRALNTKEYSAIPFYRKCGFIPATAEVEGANLFMYRIVKK